MGRALQSRFARLLLIAFAGMGLVDQLAPPAQADFIWSGFAGNPQHTAVSSVAAQNLTAIRWQTPVDQNPQYTGGALLLIHYGSPVVTSANTVIVPVKTGATGGFEVQARAGSNGSLKYTQTTNYILPPHSWTPSYAPALTTPATSDRLYYAGAGGTVYFRDNPDGNSAVTPTQLAFYGLSSYQSNPAAYDANVFINTPITADAAGNVYFGVQVANPAAVGGLQSSIVRIDPAGNATAIAASTAASDGAITKVAHNSAPALSNDGAHLYVAVNTGAGTSNGNTGYLVKLDSTTLQPVARVALMDALNPGVSALLSDNGTASPTVGPDGDVYLGVLENPLVSARGWMLHFSDDLSQSKPAGAFGWDSTASVVDASLVPSYMGTSDYLVMTKYNSYAGFGPGGDGQNKLAILDPNATQIDPRTGATVMKEVMTILGPTLDPQPGFPDARREWCINTAVVDPFTHSVLVNSADGKLYRWDLWTNTFSQEIRLTAGILEGYTPTFIAADGTVYAINDATLFAVAGVPEPSSLALGLIVAAAGGAAWWLQTRRKKVSEVLR